MKLGIQFKVAICWLNEATNRFYLKIFSDEQFKLSNTGFTLLPIKDRRFNNQETRKAIRL